jgi:hypothetical protein
MTDPKTTICGLIAAVALGAKSGVPDHYQWICDTIAGAATAAGFYFAKDKTKA